MDTSPYSSRNSALPLTDLPPPFIHSSCVKNWITSESPVLLERPPISFSFPSSPGIPICLLEHYWTFQNANALGHLLCSHFSLTYPICIYSMCTLFPFPVYPHLSTWSLAWSSCSPNMYPWLVCWISITIFRFLYNVDFCCNYNMIRIST